MLKSALTSLLIILLFVSTLGYTLKRLENPEFLIDQSRKANLYGRLTNQAHYLIPKETLEAIGFDKEETREIVIKVIDAETFYRVLEDYLNAAVQYLNGRSDQFQFSYNLVPLKQKAADEIAQKYLAKYAALPVCEPKDLTTWKPEKEFPSCQIAEEKVKNNDIERIFKKRATDGLASLPEAISVNGPNQGLKNARDLIWRADQVITITWWLTALTTLLMLLILRARALRPLAVAFITVGSLQIGFSLIAWDWMARAVGEFLGGSDAKTLVPIIADILASILEILKTTLGNISIIMFGLGLMFLVLAIVDWLHRPRQSQIN
jgi:hypothetical protein